MAHTRERMKGRASYADFIGIPRRVADSQAFKTLPSLVRALYVDLRRQFNGRNNGDISASDYGPERSSIGLKQYGWAHSSIHKGLAVLQAHGLIEKTRQGGIASMSRVTTLYAFTDSPVIANPAKGICGSQGSWTYQKFAAVGSGCPHCDPAAIANLKAKVQGVDANVRRVDFQRSTA